MLPTSLSGLRPNSALFKVLKNVKFSISGYWLTNLQAVVYLQLLCASGILRLHRQQEIKILTSFATEQTRSSADADNAFDAFSGQSRPCRISDGTLTHVRHMTLSRYSITMS